MDRLLALLSRLPLPVLYALALLAWPVVMSGARYRRDVVESNLAHALPELSPRQRRRIRRRFYLHFCNVAAEALRGMHLPPEQLASRVRVHNWEAVAPFLEQRQSLLMLTLHQGNWEWLLGAVAQRMPCPTDVIYKPLHNQAVDRFMQASRARFNSRPVPIQRTMREMLRRRREFRTFAMLADQAPFKKDRMSWHWFLNRPAAFYLGPQTIAEATQYPVIFVHTTRRRLGHYDAHFEVLARPPIARDGSEVLDAYVDAVERAIRRQPETWLWSNRKWKHDPPEDFLLTTDPPAPI